MDAIFARRLTRSIPMLVLLVLPAACGDGVITDPRPDAASIAVLPAEAAVVPGGVIALRAVVRDAAGRTILDPDVTWTTSSSGITISLRGGNNVAGVEVGGPVAVRGRIDGLSDSAMVSVVTSGSARIDAMLMRIDEFVTTMARYNRDLLPLNPRFEGPLEDKIAMLEDPELSSDIVRGRYAERIAVVGAREVPITALFPADTMRAHVGATLAEIERALPVLESFVGVLLPATHVRVWYGFALGSRGGGGSLFLEDQGTYESTRTGDALPYFSIVDHEIAHSFMGHESLTQFLELYAYNVPRTGSHDVADWIHTRGYVPGDAGSTGIHAILDIYRILGHAAMSDAFGALHELRPPYGEPLPQDARAAIIDRAPAARRTEVAAIVERIGT
ncbi:MAG TPA: hypothetical protein VMN60_08425 [Longimicrobiales bacterium]|nr:hypothetical protein [Longimicrobiales bacterium]